MDPNAPPIRPTMLSQATQPPRSTAPQASISTRGTDFGGSTACPQGRAIFNPFGFSRPSASLELVEQLPGLGESGRKDLRRNQPSSQRGYREHACVKISAASFSPADKAQLFSAFSPYPWDCVILFNDKKQAHVNKSLLSMHSEYWKDTFVKHKDLKSLPLTIVDFNEFIDLLSVIYPTAHPITGVNVQSLSKLAYEFEMPELLKRCDIFLTSNAAKFRRSKLLLLAQNFKLELLMTHCIRGYKNSDDIKALKKAPEYAYFHNRTKRMLLDAILGTKSPALFESAHGINSTLETDVKSSCLAKNEQRGAKILDKLASLTSCPPDIVLVVENTEIPAHKQFLSIFSDFFNNMFQSEFKESRENKISLEEVRYDEILELLSIVYPSTGYSINETNIATIMKLADRFMMPMILDRCKQELKNSSKINGALKLWLAQKYRTLADLQEDFARNCKSVEDVKKLRAEPEFDLLDDKMRALILESITE